MRIDWFLLLEELKRRELDNFEIERLHAPPPPNALDEKRQEEETEEPPRVIILDI